MKPITSMVAVVLTVFVLLSIGCSTSTRGPLVPTQETAPTTDSPASLDMQEAKTEVETHYINAHPEVREYVLWTARTFGRSGLWLNEDAFAAFPDDAREDKIQYLVTLLEQGEYGRHLCAGLAEASALKDKRLVPGLMKVAGYHREDRDYDCRAKWMAVAALARQESDDAVPLLISLVDHGNQNTRNWARAALSRKTGQDFAQDKQAWAAVVSAEDKKQPLQEVYEDAKELAQSPEELEQAITKYRSIIEIHLANEKLYQSALRELARRYEDSGRTEEGIRFFITLAYQRETEGPQDALREVISRFQLKHPEVFKKIAADMQGSSGRKPKATAAAPSEDLVKAIVQRKDQVLREKSLERLREMLSPISSPAQKRSALATLRSSLTAKFDRDPFRPLVLPLLESEDAQIRALALRCLPALNATSLDLTLVVPMAKDVSSEVRKSVGSTLIAIGKGDYGDQVVPALTKLLNDSDPMVIERTIRSMWGQYSSPEFDKLLIKLSRHPQHHGKTIYHCLSTMRSKSVPVCQRLIEELDEPDWNNSGRAAWGLTYGVVEDAKSLVEDGLLRALPEETNGYTRSQEFRALRGVATGKSRQYLSSVVDSETETEKFKELAREILKDLDGKR